MAPPNPSLQPTCWAGFASFRERLSSNVNATGLRTALRRCDLGAELPHLAESGNCGRYILLLLTPNSLPNPTPSVRSHRDPCSHRKDLPIMARLS